MPKNKNSSAQFAALWPTTFLQDALPGAENANILLVEMIEEMDTRAADMTTDYLQGDFLANPHPVVVWLKDCITVSIHDYKQNLGINYEMDWHLQAWPNINRFGDYHNLHNHPHSWLSGTYYVQVPEDTGEHKGMAP